ncbi:hypothetical protein L596_017257 [Steinernema carpocapsae]|uniref:Ubiquitin-like domain-containing protein n=1 Tax=Steinernema carpocapsae TaxID=34508 RepID=A0A4U5N138_STECR|nr:hypothetical protein L596_017257 [Steinernema carpocapsae]
MSLTDVYVEVVRGKQHLFFWLNEQSHVAELKKIVEGILKIAPEDQTLKVRKATNEEWRDMESDKPLSEYGITPSIATAQNAYQIALVIPEDNGKVVMDSLSQPPPIPDAMRRDEQQPQGAQAESA